MENFVELVGMENTIRVSEVTKSETNFEVIYGRLHSNSLMREQLTEIEDKVRRYFCDMRLPAEPTLYDHLLLSLRGHDLIATFNWDPLLFDSWERLSNQFGQNHLPTVAYLHGNVRVGYCLDHKVCGRNGRICPDCDKTLTPTPLLFPIENKDYESDEFIKNEWQRLQAGLEHASAVTIFGYGAPASDRAAIDTMRAAWSGEGERQFETIFIIDVKPEIEIEDSWRPFFFGHHYRIEKDFYDSWLPRHARRSIETLMVPTAEGRFVEDLPIPFGGTWSQLEDWFRDMARIEERFAKDK